MKKTRFSSSNFIHSNFPEFTLTHLTTISFWECDENQGRLLSEFLVQLIEFCLNKLPHNTILCLRESILDTLDLLSERLNNETWHRLLWIKDHHFIKSVILKAPCWISPFYFEIIYLDSISFVLLRMKAKGKVGNEIITDQQHNVIDNQVGLVCQDNLWDLVFPSPFSSRIIPFP